MEYSKEELIRRFNALSVEGMGEVTELSPLPGRYLNLEYTLADGRKVKLLSDEGSYYAAQIHKEGSHRCYGLAAGDGYLLVCEYGDGGSEPEIVVYQRL